MARSRATVARWQKAAKVKALADNAGTPGEQQAAEAALAASTARWALTSSPAPAVPATSLASKRRGAAGKTEAAKDPVPLRPRGAQGGHRGR